jgi:two-component system, cell cycle response regulator DivK
MRLDVSPRAPVDVLIADDDAQLRSSVRLFLEAQGFSCAEAADGPQTVTVANALKPRCVLLDLGMPGLDGFAVARRLRADPRTAQAHVHCLTGRADPASRRQAEAAGCELYLTKPVDPTVVAAAVGGWTGLTYAAAAQLLDWLETHGYAPAAVSYEEGGSFAIRLRTSCGIASLPNADTGSIADAEPPGCGRRDEPQPVRQPMVGRLARYRATYRAQSPGGHLVVRVTRIPTLLACAAAALGSVACHWLGILTWTEMGVVAALLAVILAIPPEERWLPLFPASFQRDLADGSVIEFDGIPSETGHHGHRGMMHRTVQIVRIVRS